MNIGDVFECIDRQGTGAICKHTFLLLLIFQKTQRNEPWAKTRSSSQLRRQITWSRSYWRRLKLWKKKTIRFCSSAFFKMLLTPINSSALRMKLCGYSLRLSRWTRTCVNFPRLEITGFVILFIHRLSSMMSAIILRAVITVTTMMTSLMSRNQRATPKLSAHRPRAWFRWVFNVTSCQFI